MCCFVKEKERGRCIGEGGMEESEIDRMTERGSVELGRSQYICTRDGRQRGNYENEWVNGERNRDLKKQREAGRWRGTNGASKQE